MDLEKLLKEAYISGVVEAQIAEKIPNMIFNFDGMATAYAQQQLKNLTITGVSKSVCPKCGNTGRCEPRTLSDPDGQECDCGANCC